MAGLFFSFPCLREVMSLVAQSNVKHDKIQLLNCHMAFILSTGN